MSVEKTIRGFTEAYMAKNIEETLSFLTDDIVWTAPEGTFNGKEEVRRLVTWSLEDPSEFKFRETTEK